MQSMTGFGSREVEIAPLGKICVELRSTNHKFLETVIHLPEGFLSLEDRIKRQIESKIKRGRVTCVVTIVGGESSKVYINKLLVRDYLAAIRNIQEEFKLQDELNINTLVHLPGVISLEGNKVAKELVWPRLKKQLHVALSELLKTRFKEGQALGGYLKRNAEALKAHLDLVKIRFRQASKEKLKLFASDEERASFLKDSDISEEISRLEFHIRNFKNKLHNHSAIGKELDFIAQEMQREANTMAAKSFDAAISARTVAIKSQIEKIREQAQNIE
jgi:uncharacterized protein (TIGR00255 family)